MGEIWILDAAQMREADARAIAAGTPGAVLMERAGAAVARAARDAVPADTSILVVCGPGNNGGDGFVAARLLAEEGRRVSLALLGSRDALRGDAAGAAARWTGPVEDARACAPERAGLVIDALFGTGLTRDLDGDAAAVVAALAACARPILSVDIPSGVDADTGRIRGVALTAMRTVTFATRKPGHLLLPGRLHCGHVSVADIGVDPGSVADVGAPAFADEPELWTESLPRPSVDAHKYARGHALVLSGGIARTGAARLVARGALRAGAGAVTLVSPRSALMVNATHLTAIMLAPCDGPEELADLLADARVTAVALGPGFGVGEACRAMAQTAARSGRALVLDADGLTSFEGEPEAIAALAAQARALVLTPHEGETRRLFSNSPEILEAPSRLSRARAASALTRAIVVDKGADTVVAAPDGRAAILGETTPYLATAGSGDALAGFVTGLLAQGMPAFEAACAAIWLHARTGIACGPGLVAEDLPEALPGVLAGLR
ncbi:MAG: NAD(P)H-hydrate epimerase [Salinarimonadaceae bacterium]|nr:MAG: NAD(P)H-hydrate epimerase [Salinarimonadaceae bacterium]